eukprot:scaffold41153_cov38-Attheya_sp.AAC.2
MTSVRKPTADHRPRATTRIHRIIICSMLNAVTAALPAVRCELMLRDRMPSDDGDHLFRLVVYLHLLL